MASLVNTELMGAQVSEVYKWLCFVSYLCLSADERAASKLDDVQFILEHVAKNRARDLSESGQWWELFSDNRDMRIYASFLISSIRRSSRSLTLGLNAQQKRSLAFYFSEFRGLALSLRSARDSEAHRCFAGGEAAFNGCYGVQALRLFDVAQALYDLVLQVAHANREEATRFSFRIARPSREEIEPYRFHISAEVASSGILQVGQPSPGSAQAPDLPSSSEGEMLSAPEFLSQIEQIMQDGLEASTAPIQELRDFVRQELASMRGELQSYSRQLLPLAPAGAQLPQEQSDVKAHGDAPRAREATGDLGRDLITLRDEIYESMQHQLPGFKHYNNILQRPIVRQALQNGVGSYAELKALPEFQSRIIGMSRGFSLAEQEAQFSHEIDQLLARYQAPF